MTRRRLLGGSLILLLAAVSAVLSPHIYWLGVGHWKREPFYRHRPASYWEQELSHWTVGSSVVFFTQGHADGPAEVRVITLRKNGWQRSPPEWVKALDRALAHLRVRRPWKHEGEEKTSSPPLLDGGPEALPVLLALLRSPRADTRYLAVRGLERIGSPAREAVPALLELRDDEDDEIRRNVEDAIRTLDPEAARGAGLK